MLSRFSIQEGCIELGQPEELGQFCFDATSDLTRHLEKQAELIRQVLVAQAHPDEVTNLGVDISKVFSYSGIYELLTRHITITDDQDSDNADALITALLEAITNAIKHGSEYGRRGPVAIRIAANRHRILCVIDDPGEGIPNWENLFERLLYRTAEHNSSLIGNGLHYLAETGTRQRWSFEKLTNGFRTMVLFAARQ